MPIKWKTSEVSAPGGTVKVTHWARHDPEALVAALAVKPLKEIGFSPRVTVHRFGRLALAKRHFAYWPDYSEAQELFEKLQQLADKRLSTVETPVALVTREEENPVVVTIWKKRTVSLFDFLDSERVSRAAKEKASLSAMRKLAQFHAAGEVHGHVKPDNFVVDRNGNAHFVDYTRLLEGKFTPATSECQSFLNSCANLVHFKPDSAGAAKFRLALRHEYDKWRRVYGKRFGTSFEPRVAGESRYAYARLARREK